MTDLVVGSAARGTDYFGQQALVESLWGKLQKTNVLLVAPRRFGKTSAMYRLLDAPRNGFSPVYIDVEPVLSAADFMVELLAALLRDRRFARVLEFLRKETKEIGGFFRKLPEEIEAGSLKIKLREHTDIPRHWTTYGDRLMAILAKSDRRVLLLIDELAIMIEGILERDANEAKQFLRWFRAARIAPDTQTRFVISSSINLVATLDAHGLVDTVNDLHLERLKPFSSETAGAFVDEIFANHGVQLPRQVRDAILELVGTPIPYLLAVFLSAILERLRASQSALTVDLARAVFEEDLLGGATSAVFSHYRSRIGQYYPGPQAQAAKAILGVLSRSSRPVRIDVVYQVFLKATSVSHGPASQEDFSQLMNKLINDFYIVNQRDRYGFHSRVLQLWWRAHYGFQHE
jgi:hypothetical protein